jgi:hypothetical protein
MGATQEQATNAMSLLASEVDSETHPNKRKRIQAIIEGWNEANKQKYLSAIPPPPSDDKNFASETGYVKDEFTKEELISEVALNSENFGGVINSYKYPLQEGIIIDVDYFDPTDGARTDYFDLPRSDSNMVLTIHHTKKTIGPLGSITESGKRYKYHLLDYYQMSKADKSWLEAILVPGRKIQFKSFYFGYEVEDLFYIKKIER